MRGLCDSLSEYPIILKRLVRNFTVISQCRCESIEGINDLSSLLIASWPWCWLGILDRELTPFLESTYEFQAPIVALFFAGNFGQSINRMPPSSRLAASLNEGLLKQIPVRKLIIDCKKRLIHTLTWTWNQFDFGPLLVLNAAFSDDNCRLTSSSFHKIFICKDTWTPKSEKVSRIVTTRYRLRVLVFSFFFF